MKTASGALVTLLNGTSQFLMADLYTFTFAAVVVSLTAENDPFAPTGTTGQLAIGGVPVTAEVSVTGMSRLDWH